MPIEGEVRINKRDPNRKATFTGGVWVEQSGGSGPKARPDWGPGAVEMPDGQIVRYGTRGGTTVLHKGNRAGDEGETPDLREFEINAAARASLMDSGIRSYDKAKAEGYDPTSTKNILARGIEDVPWLPGGNYLADVIRDNPSERARAAELQFTDGALRTTSGAGIKADEVRSASRQFFRQPGEAPTVEPERALIRERFRTTSKRAAGKAYVDAPEGFGTLEDPFDLSKGQSRKSIPVGSIYRDQQGNLRENKNFDRGNPVVKWAEGAKPQGGAPPSGQPKRLVYDPATGELK